MKAPAATSGRLGMKKCSKTAHHSLTELNITPLLDLAFVLLVIFIITTTPIVNDLDLSLPKASKHEKDPPRKANYVTVDNSGTTYLNKREVTPEELLQQLIAVHARKIPGTAMLASNSCGGRFSV